MAKDDKFGPLCKSFHKSLYSSSAFDGGEATITAIYNVLQATQANPGRVIEKGNAKYVRAVFKRIQEKIDLFPKSDHFQVCRPAMGARSVGHTRRRAPAQGACHARSVGHTGKHTAHTTTAAACTARDKAPFFVLVE